MISCGQDLCTHNVSAYLQQGSLRGTKQSLFYQIATLRCATLAMTISWWSKNRASSYDWTKKKVIARNEAISLIAPQIASALRASQLQSGVVKTALHPKTIFLRSFCFKLATSPSHSPNPPRGQTSTAGHGSAPLSGHPSGDHQ